MLAGERMAVLHHPAALKNVSRCPEAATRKLVAIGGSAGAIQALIGILSALPADFALPILIVQHISAKRASACALPAVLGWRSALTVKWAEHGERAEPGTAYVAPPDRHLLIRPGQRIALSSAARMGWWRPAIDALFLSAAETCGAETAAVVLSGALWDGAKGTAAIARQGGITIAQDERSCSHFDMPAASIDFGRADIVMAPDRIAEALLTLADAAGGASYGGQPRLAFSTVEREKG